MARNGKSSTRPATPVAAPTPVTARRGRSSAGSAGQGLAAKTSKRTRAMSAFGVPVGAQVPLDVANRQARERDTALREAAEETGEAVKSAVMQAMAPPEARRRARSNPGA